MNLRTKISRLAILLLLLCSCLALSAFPVWADFVQETISGEYDYDLALEIWRLTNAERTARGLQPLVYDNNSESFAMQRAAEISVVFSHLRPDGSDFAYGENNDAGASSAAASVQRLMDSTEHRANILHPDYRSLAVGVFFRGGKMYVSQEFYFYQDGGAPSGYFGRLAVTPIVQLKSGSSAAGAHMDGDVLYMQPGEHWHIGATVTGADGSSYQGALNWSSDNESVAAVYDGEVHAIGEGETRVRCSVPNSDLSRSTLVIVGGQTSEAPPPVPIVQPQMPYGGTPVGALAVLNVTAAETVAASESPSSTPAPTTAAPEATQPKESQLGPSNQATETKAAATSKQSEQTTQAHPTERKLQTPQAKQRPTEPKPTQQQAAVSEAKTMKTDEGQSWSDLGPYIGAGFILLAIAGVAARFVLRRR